MTEYVIGPVLGFGLAVVLTIVIRRVAVRWNIVDDPASAPDRKLHARPTPLLGGAAIILAGITTWWLIDWMFPNQPLIPTRNMIGLSLAGLWLLIGGWIDDRYHVKPGWQLIWPVLAAISAITFGIGVDFITNPFGGLIYLHRVADIFSFVWLMGMMYTTKILDGLDGLVSGVGVIGSLVVFLLTLRPEVNQPGLGLVGLIFGASCLGFLLFNWHPAKIFLGESGALFIGFMLGVLAIISGGKIATALLIMGLPILDLAWVILQRRLGANVSPFRTSDRRHLHFRLVDSGISIRKSVLLLYALTLLFGLATLWFTGPAKLVALGVVLIVLAVLVLWLSRRLRRQAPQPNL